MEITVITTVAESIISLLGVYEKMKAQRMAEANMEDDKIIADLDLRILTGVSDMDLADKEADDDLGNKSTKGA